MCRSGMAGATRMARDPPREPISFKLRRGTTIGGIVVHADDQPVEGVTVVLTVTKSGPGKRAANPTGDEACYEVPATTGPDGRWRSDSVPPGAEEVRLQLIHPDFVSDESTTRGNKGRSPKLEPLRKQSDRQVLLKGQRIDGRVLDDHGRPIAGARVVDSSRGLTFLPYVWRTTTDAEGRFHIHLPRGKTVSLTVQAPGYQPATREIGGAQDSPTVEFRLPPGRRLRARVVNTRGKPIVGAFAFIPSMSTHRGIFFRAWTDTEGRFEWADAPDEKVAFSIGAEGYLPDGPFWLAPGDEESAVVLRPGVAVRLGVIDAGTGKPIRRLKVQVGQVVGGGRDVRFGEPSTTDGNGEYRSWLDAEGGPYRIRILADGYAPAETRTFRGDEKEYRETLRLEKERE